MWLSEGQFFEKDQAKSLRRSTTGAQNTIIQRTRLKSVNKIKMTFKWGQEGILKILRFTTLIKRNWKISYCFKNSQWNINIWMTNKLQIKLILLRVIGFWKYFYRNTAYLPSKAEAIEVLKFLHPNFTLVIHLYTNIKSLKFGDFFPCSNTLLHSM